jgi:hypothetical protein
VLSKKVQNAIVMGDVWCTNITVKLNWTVFIYFSLGKVNESKAQMSNDSASTSAPGWDQGSDYPGGLYYVDHANSK